MTESFTSIAEWLHKRATTAIIGTYLGFWALVHWQLLYTTLFVSEDMIYEKFHLLKNEYINIYFIQWHGFWHGIESLIGYITPLVLTFIAIWVLPDLIFIRAFKKERDYKTKKRIVVLKSDRQIEEERSKLAEENKKTLTAQRDAIVIEKDIENIDPNKANEEAYQLFLSTPNAGYVLNKIKEIIYEYNGHINRYYERANRVWVEPPIDSNTIAKAHANSLIDIQAATNDADSKIISLTEKGRYFLSKSL